MSIEHSPARQGARILRYRDLTDMGFGSRVTIWRRVRSGDFPTPHDVLDRPAWFPEEIESWLEKRPLR